jgi:hypothetical protein
MSGGPGELDDPADDQAGWPCGCPCGCLRMTDPVGCPCGMPLRMPLRMPLWMPLGGPRFQQGCPHVVPSSSRIISFSVVPRSSTRLTTGEGWARTSVPSIPSVHLGPLSEHWAGAPSLLTSRWSVCLVEGPCPCQVERSVTQVVLCPGGGRVRVQSGEFLVPR